jgi:hypothetical protein
VFDDPTHLNEHVAQRDTGGDHVVYAIVGGHQVVHALDLRPGQAPLQLGGNSDRGIAQYGEFIDRPRRAMRICHAQRADELSGDQDSRFGVGAGTADRVGTQRSAQIILK